VNQKEKEEANGKGDFSWAPNRLVIADRKNKENSSQDC
jgi:hypothetical protein